MNLQQLEYIIAVDRYRHFAKAAEACGVTQPTLSSMIQKLEDELKLSIFDRSKHPVELTSIGKIIIERAGEVLLQINKIKEIAFAEKNVLSGNLRIGIIPTVAPYLLPKLFGELKTLLPQVKLSVSEMRTQILIEELKKGELDVAILVTPLNENSLLEIPLYYEKFIAYISPSDQLYSLSELKPENLESEKMWLLQEGHCFRSQVLNYCKQNLQQNHTYEAGSIETLIRIVDQNEGYTVIPELHLPSLNENQKQNIRPFTVDSPVREVSLVIRHDFVREAILNVIIQGLKEIIPVSMMDKRLSKFKIKL